MFVHEWPLGLLKILYPDYMKYLMLPGIDLTDPDYLVRVEYLEDGTINQLELGYANDEWYLKV